MPTLTLKQPCFNCCATCLLGYQDIDDNTDGYKVTNVSHNIAGQIYTTTAVNLTLAVTFPDGFARAVWEVNGSNVYDTGCINTSNQAIVNISATNFINVTVIQQCSGTWIENGWLASTFCA